ncbi:P-loop containing nucleoside triphosphate hydrolase protein [Mycena maculata]|uniref:P-loop containing nucleoside triphosphate hydrolase protein n=1 Tax=Mycena maculata TaxID=230809 RepID=A0AAD7ICP6_9AGAR|nr:P-loop containing nucleoside triphosphate hydrolase protein [Mycena maculata]
MAPRRIKLVVVGDGACGKTSLLIVYAYGKFPEAYIPNVFEGHVADVDLEGERIELALWDTEGQEYRRLRPLAFPDAHVILICFAVDNPDSLDNVQEKWIKEIQHLCYGVPFILVGCKTDLRTDPPLVDEQNKVGQRTLTTEEGRAVAKKVGAHEYLECSAKSGQGVNEVFLEVALVGRRPRHFAHPSPMARCIVL